MIRLESHRVSALVVLAAVTIAAGCGQSGSNEAASGTAPRADASSPAAPAVKTASSPSDACGWIPAAEVEAVIGKLAGPPRAAGDECVYPLAQKSESFAKLLEMRRSFR